MKLMRFATSVLLLLALLLATPARPLQGAQDESALLYVASPGVRNYVEHGGVGILVFDIAAGHRFVKRIPTVDLRAGEAPENIKGIAASAETSRLYLTTPRRVVALDLKTERIVWNRTYEGGCDRMAIAPDGTILYVPSFEGPSGMSSTRGTATRSAQWKPTRAPTTRSTASTAGSSTSRGSSPRC